MTTITQNPAFSMFKADTRVSFVRPFNPSEAVSIEGFRHEVIRYRDADKAKGTASKPAKVVTIPALDLPADTYVLPSEAKQILMGVLEKQQETLIREAIDNGASMIEWDSVNLDKTLSALTAVRVSERLTKEQIHAWIDVALDSVLKGRASAISIAKGHTELQASMQQAATRNDYKNALGTLSAPVPKLKQQSAMACKNLLVQANIADDISKALLKKLDAILNPEINSENL